MIVAPDVFLFGHCPVKEYFLSFINCPPEDNVC